MKNHYDKDIRKYIQATKRLIICPKEYRKQFIDDMERDLNQFIQENPSVGYSGITDYFGTPDELAQTYLDNIPKEELADYKIKRKFRSVISRSIFATFILCTVFYLFILLWQANELKVIYVHESIKILDENTEP